MKNRSFAKGIFIEALRRTGVLTALVLILYLFISITVLIEAKGEGLSPDKLDTLYNSARSTIFVPYICSFITAIAVFSTAFAQRHSDFYGALHYKKSSMFFSLSAVTVIQTVLPILLATFITVGLKHLIFPFGEAFQLIEYVIFTTNLILSALKLSAAAVLAYLITGSTVSAVLAGAVLCVLPESVMFILSEDAITYQDTWWGPFNLSECLFMGKNMSASLSCGIQSLIIGLTMYIVAVIIAFNDSTFKKSPLPPACQVAFTAIISSVFFFLAAWGRNYSGWLLFNIIFTSMGMFFAIVTHIISNRGFKRMKLFGITAAVLGSIFIITSVAIGGLSLIFNDAPKRPVAVYVVDDTGSSFGVQLGNYAIRDKNVLEIVGDKYNNTNVEIAGGDHIDGDRIYKEYRISTVMGFNYSSQRRYFDSDIELIEDYILNDARLFKRCGNLPTATKAISISVNGRDITDNVTELYNVFKGEFDKLSPEDKVLYSNFFQQNESYYYKAGNYCDLVINDKVNGRLYTNRFHIPESVFPETFKLLSAL